MKPGTKLTEADGRRALQDHVADKAMEARLKYGLYIDAETIVAMLDDVEVVRYPTGLRFDGEALLPGEFAHAQPIDDHPSGGFCIFLHPWFEQMPDAWPLLIAYHVPSINYGDIATADDAELYGATLLGMDVDAYYNALCELVDSIPSSDGAAS